jgi:hypothetical protein
LKKAPKNNTSKEPVQAEPPPKRVIGFHYPDNLKYPQGIYTSTRGPPKDYRGLPVSRTITSTSLAEPLPSPYIQPSINLPLDEKYDLTRHREYIRKGLIEKARAEKYDDEFEKPRPAPMPQVRRRDEEFEGQRLWVPFEMPRATPKPPEVRKRERDGRMIPPPPKYVPIDVSRFSR